MSTRIYICRQNNRIKPDDAVSKRSDIIYQPKDAAGSRSNRLRIIQPNKPKDTKNDETSSIAYRSRGNAVESQQNGRYIFYLSIGLL